MARTKIDYTLIAPFTTTFIGLGRNRIINGDMTIDQANGGASVTVNTASPPAYGVDQLWHTGVSAEGVFTAQRLSATPPTGFLFYTRVTVTTADASVTTNQSYRSNFVLEGYAIKDFLLGTANAKAFAVSFWVRSSLTGSFGGAVLNGTSAVSYPFSYTISAANTWEYKTVSIPGTNSGTWPSDNSSALQLHFGHGIGPTFSGPANAWATATYMSPTGSVQLIGTNGATWDITGVQLEIGNVSTPFEYMPFEMTLLMCQRYYEKTYAVDTAVASNTATNTYFVMGAQIGATTVQYGSIPFKIPKRATPTMTLYRNDGTSGSWAFTSTAGASTNRTVTAAATSTNAFLPEQTAALEYRGSGHWVADARL